MELDEIKKGVQTSIDKWLEFERMSQNSLELTKGASELVVQMIVNIKDDPSPSWKEVELELDSVQRFVISTIPNILLDMNREYRSFNWKQQKVSSWEILHKISDALDKWCPIPKDI